MDLYRGLRVVMEKLGSDEGCLPLALPALGSFLWSEIAIPDLAHCDISNRDFLDAVRALAFTLDNKVLRSVDYKNLGSEELGSIYESLLELHPDLDIDAATFNLSTAGGHERKTTGSYYTPTSLIQYMLDSALDPVLDEAVHQPNAEEAILSLKVCDPACGSGHFLIAAAHRIARRLAALRTGDEEPSPEAIHTALRDVISRCIYGVDMNPMAVELCKVSLWMEALEPGKPLTFLDHHIQCGNSLLGTTPALLAQGIPDVAFTSIEGDDKTIVSALRRRNRAERAGQMTFAAIAESAVPYGSLADTIANIDAIDDSAITGVHDKEECYAHLAESSEYRKARLAADAWCAAFVWKKTKDAPGPVTHDVIGRLLTEPVKVSAATRVEIGRLAEQYNFFHWHLAFPDVFRLPVDDDEPENVHMGWNGGFDVVLGNPPWERIKLQDKEWFAEQRQDIANASNAAARRKLIAFLEQEDPQLLDAFLEARREAEGPSHLSRNSGRYPLCGCGDINTYALFAELAKQLVAPRGVSALILPLGVATDNTTKEFFKTLIHTQTLMGMTGFINEERLFRDVLHNFKFCIFVAGGRYRTIQFPEFVFNAYNIEEARDDKRRFVLSEDDIRLLNPITETCPTFFWRRSADITKEIYRSNPILDNEVGKSGWQIDFFSMLHMGTASELFATSREPDYLPVYESKMFNQFNHRFASYHTLSEGQRAHMLPETPVGSLRNPTFTITPCYYVPALEVHARLDGKVDREWLIASRRITSAGLIRTSICTVLPLVGGSDSITLITTTKHIPVELATFVAMLNSFAFDFCTRQKQAGANLSFFLLHQLPVVPFEKVSQHAPWQKLIGLLQWISDRVLELTYNSWDLEPFAIDCGYSGPPFRWDEERRFLLRCELDAAYFHLYGITRDDVDYIMETFPIVKRNDMKQYGDFRTKLMILDIYDRMQQAMDTGEPYQTLLDPPPADPRVAHPPRTEN
jgi:hypothetical protein